LAMLGECFAELGGTPQVVLAAVGLAATLAQGFPVWLAAFGVHQRISIESSAGDVDAAWFSWMGFGFSRRGEHRCYRRCQRPPKRAGLVFATPGPGVVPDPVATSERRLAERNLMSSIDKAKNAAQEAKGKVKESAGKASDDERLEAEGKADQAGANLKQAGEKVKDAFKD